jgi:hypothetical protein
LTPTSSLATIRSMIATSYPSASTITFARIPNILIGLTCCHFVELCSMHHVNSFI